MAFKLLILAASLAVANAGLLGAPAAVGYASPAIAAYAAPVVKAVNTDYDPNPSYNYAYDIQDALTGDSKNQQESRQGDVVQGSYSLTEPDGSRRTVEYTADPVNGFNAVVHKQGVAVAAAPVVTAPIARTYAAPALAYGAPAIARTAYAAPIARAYAAPALAYGAPAIARTAYAAPIARAYAAPTLAYGAPAIARTAYAAPIARAYAAPALAYGAPAIARTAYAAPIARAYAAPYAAGYATYGKASYSSPYATYAY